MNNNQDNTESNLNNEETVNTPTDKEIKNNNPVDVNDVSLKKYLKIGGLSLLGLFTIMGAIMFAANTLNLSVFYVAGNSMSPTLKNNDVVVLKYDKYINREDVVFFRNPSKWAEVSGVTNNRNIVVKRATAVPGDELKINENGVYVNDEQKIDFKDIDYTCNFVSNGNEYSHILTKEQLFLTGDNHKNSLDSLRVLCEQGDNNAYLSNMEVMQYGKIIAQT